MLKRQGEQTPLLRRFIIVPALPSVPGKNVELRLAAMIRQPRNDWWLTGPSSVRLDTELTLSQLNVPRTHRLLFNWRLEGGGRAYPSEQAAKEEQWRDWSG